MTVTAFQRVRIACDNLQQASADYEDLLGAAPVWKGQIVFPAHKEACECAWFALGNTIIEFIQWPDVDTDFKPHIAGLVMESDVVERTGDCEYRCRNGDVHSSPEQLLDKDRVCQQWVSLQDKHLKQTLCPAPVDVNQATQVQRVDHIVLYTNDGDACIEAFGEPGLGVRLALDKTVPEWGGRMLFFRAGKLTLEVIQPNKGLQGDDYFWGIAYQVEDLQAFLQRAHADGVQTSEIRKGRKPGTRVATIKSHHLGIPTLLVEPATNV